MTHNKWYINKVISTIDKDINDKLILAGEVISSAAKKNAPVKTGNLRDSINYEVNEQDKSVTIGTNVSYAPYIELGTKNIKPTFFLTRALAENINKIKAIFAKKIK